MPAAPRPRLPELPIAAALPGLLEALRVRPCAVLQAPPGAGKTTIVPLALLDAEAAPWLAGRTVIMLEPRRLAARAAARRMAALLGERVGETVGYRVRLDTRVGPATRIEVVTEGVLARMLQEDPALERVGLLVFDEFHERSLHADLGLALALQSQALLREELRILVMSATLDGAAVAALIGGDAGPAPIVTSEGRSFPVETRYAPPRPDVRLEAAAAAAVREALAREAEGDVLVFLPGAGEIRRVEARLAEGPLDPRVRVLPLHGSLPAEAQDAAIAPARAGERKVVLATSIAETSLTIEGVRVVVDTGWARVPRFSPRTGMTRLATVRVTRAAADQRRGRAGRLGPGVCWRLWGEHEQHALVPHATPEILEADLAALALELAEAGIADPLALRWLDPPPAAAYAQARELLRALEALDEGGRITPHGRRMAALALHPRLAHMLLAAGRLEAGRLEGARSGTLACTLAALLAERDVLRGTEAGPPDPDVRLRLDALRDAARGRMPTAVQGWPLDRAGCRRVLEEARHWRRLLRLGERVDDVAPEAESAGLLLAFAYPDRIAQRREGQRGRWLLRNGNGAALANPAAGTPALLDAEFLVAAELDGVRGSRESRVLLAAPVARAELETHFGAQLEGEDVVAWDEATGAVRARRRTRLGALVLADAPLRDPDPAAVADALLETVRREGLALLPWSDAARRLQARVAFLRRLDPSWPDLSDAALLATLDDWLRPQLAGVRRRDELARLDLHAVLLDRLDWRRRAALDELAPTHVTVPTGSRIPVDYADPEAPVLAVRLQELFGQRETPRVGGGRVALTLHLLSPAHRPVQVTRDLEGFWRGSYAEVRKDMRGRYPKHPWPEDPLGAEPTRRAKPRGR